MTTEEPKFQVGDKVSWMGSLGRVTTINTINHDGGYKVRVSFFNGEVCYFYENGKYLDWHLEPSLILVERKKPKPKMVRYYRCWFQRVVGVIFRGHIYDSWHDSIESARRDANASDVRLVKFCHDDWIELPEETE